MKFFSLFSVFVCVALSVSAQPQLLGNFPYKARESNYNNIGLLVEAGVNTTHHSIVANPDYMHSAKGSISFAPKLGIYFQKGFDKSFSIRGYVLWGTNNFSYRYATKYDSTMRGYIPALTEKYKGDYSTYSHRAHYIIPQIDVGYVFVPIKEMYMIEFRLGLSLPMYLNRLDEETSIENYSHLYNNNRDLLRFQIEERAVLGGNKTWGALHGMVYAGIRWTNVYSELLKRSGLGFTLNVPMADNHSGYSRIVYRTSDWDELIGTEKIKFNLWSVGVTYTYSFLRLD